MTVWSERRRQPRVAQRMHEFDADWRMAAGIEMLAPQLEQASRRQGGVRSTDSLSSAARPHVVVVELNPGVRRLLDVTLRSLGCRVSAAADGNEALVALSDPSVRLLLADLAQPGMQAVDLAAVARVRHPGLPVVLMSGMCSESLRVPLPAAGFDLLLGKPIKFDALKQAVALSLSGTTSYVD